MLVKKNSLSFNVELCTLVKPNEDWFGGSRIFWNEFICGKWEPETFTIFDQYCSLNNSYLDIGAWIGPTVLYGAQLSKKCYAFEPDPVAFEFLTKNVKLNPNISNIELNQCAISDHTGTMQFGSNTILGDSMSSILWSKNSMPVNCMSLEDFISSNNIQDCNFIKMDIEGEEFTTLPAAKNILEKIQPTLYLSLHTPWFDDKRLFLQTIANSLLFYKKIYLSNGRLINNQDILKLSGFISIIATNK